MEGENGIGCVYNKAAGVCVREDQITDAEWDETPPATDECECPGSISSKPSWCHHLWRGIPTARSTGSVLQRLAFVNDLDKPARDDDEELQFQNYNFGSHPGFGSYPGYGSNPGGSSYGGSYGGYGGYPATGRYAPEGVDSAINNGIATLFGLRNARQTQQEARRTTCMNNCIQNNWPHEQCHRSCVQQGLPYNGVIRGVDSAISDGVQTRNGRLTQQQEARQTCMTACIAKWGNSSYDLCDRSCFWGPGGEVLGG